MTAPTKVTEFHAQNERRIGDRSRLFGALAASLPDARTVLHRDYRTDLPLTEGSVDVLVSLFAGFISEHCTRYLKRGGVLLVNSSHGYAALASIDSRNRLRP